MREELDNSIDTKEENVSKVNVEEDINDYKSEKKATIIKEIKSYIIIIAAAIAVAVIVNTFVLSNTRIPTGSMENTINCGNRLFGNRLAYKFSEVRHGDIIIFKFPDNPSINYIKRVIGVPGDTVVIDDGDVLVNGKVIEEDYIKEKTQGSFGPYEVPEDCYFVMGDNRNNSNDARFWDNTYVHKDDIIAKAVLRYWPSFKIVK